MDLAKARPKRQRARNRTAAGQRSRSSADGALSATAEPDDGPSRIGWIALFAAFLLAALAIYSPALDGAFISDDEHYVQRNVYVHELTLDNLAAILDPTSVLAIVVENYAPVHVLMHAVEWQFFGPRTRGYHVVNLIFHALASCLLVTLLRRSGVAWQAACLGGAFFLVHPANVEAVAWINQLKTSSAMVLALGALLAHPRRPGLGALLFALALLAKPTAAVALFVALAFGWSRTRPKAKASKGAKASTRAEASTKAKASTKAEGSKEAEESTDSWRWGWLAGWAVILGLFAVAEFAAFSQTAGQAPPIYAELDTRFRSIFAVALRYLVMATTSYGLSTFHEPDPADSFADPWFLASLVVLAGLGFRTVATLRARSPEAAWWVFALVSFGPICGLIPLPFPMADRYLYFMLPGLIGGALLFGQAGLSEWTRRSGVVVTPGHTRALQVAVLVCLALFAWRSFDRAHVWKNPYTAMADSEANYPEGTAAKTRQATLAGDVGDARRAVELLEDAHARGYNRLDHLLAGYGPIQSAPEFVALKKRWAREWIERLQANPTPSQLELRLIAQAHIVLGDLQAARREIARAIEVEGPITEDLRDDLANLDREIRFSRLRARE